MKKVCENCLCRVSGAVNLSTQGGDQEITQQRALGRPHKLRLRQIGRDRYAAFRHPA
jgi:hypothetical protein